MTAVVDEAPPAGAAPRDVVIFNGADGATGAAGAAGGAAVVDGLAGRNWRVRTGLAVSDDPAACVDSVTDLLGAPESPDRAVLIGYGSAGLAVLEFAELHPERAAAVVAVAIPDAGEPPDLACPVLVLGTSDAQAILGFLAELERSDPPARCPVRLPALTPTLLNDPDVIRQLRELGPVHRIDAGVATSWILTGHAVTTATLADPRLAGEVEITAGFRLPSPGHRAERDLVTIDGAEHARLRRLVGRHLTPARVEALRPRMRAETDALLDALPTGEPVDLLPTFARPLPIIVLCELFGVPGRDRGYVHEWLIERMTAVPPSAHDDVDDYFRAQIAQRRHRPHDDLLGWIVDAEGDRLSEDDLVAAARWLLVGGHRAPTTLLVNGVAALLGHERQWRRLVADPALVEPAVEELLRFVTPFPVGLARQLPCPVVVGDVVVPDGDLIAASLVAANRDPAVFPDPDVLDIGREHDGHLAFGHGHHHCPGAALARAVAQVAIGALAVRFPGMTLAAGTGDLQYRQSRVRYLLELPVVLRPE